MPIIDDLSIPFDPVQVVKPKKQRRQKRAEVAPQKNSLIDTYLLLMELRAFFELFRSGYEMLGPIEHDQRSSIQIMNGELPFYYSLEHFLSVYTIKCMTSYLIEEKFGHNLEVVMI